MKDFKFFFSFSMLKNKQAFWWKHNCVVFIKKNIMFGL